TSALRQQCGGTWPRRLVEIPNGFDTVFRCLARSMAHRQRPVVAAAGHPWSGRIRGLCTVAVPARPELCGPTRGDDRRRRALCRHRSLGRGHRSASHRCRPRCRAHRAARGDSALSVTVEHSGPVVFAHRNPCHIRVSVVMNDDNTAVSSITEVLHLWYATARPRHLVTETDDLATALGAAATRRPTGVYPADYPESAVR